MIPWRKLLLDLLSPPIPPPETPLLPSAEHSGTPLGCSGDKDALSCFLGDFQVSCTLPYSRAWVVLGKVTWNHLSPSLHAEETKAPRGGGWLFQGSLIVWTGLMTLSPGFSPPGLDGGLSPQCYASHGLSFSPLRNPSFPVKAWGFRITQTLPGSAGFYRYPCQAPRCQGPQTRKLPAKARCLVPTLKETLEYI